ncbi:MAG: LCP family protein [Actinomycetota bacterium]|nr:LCP family protein [Actinomycetota bacterium]
MDDATTQTRDGGGFIGFGDDDPPASPKVAKRRGFVRRHKAFTALLIVLGLIGVAVVGSALYINQQLGHIPRVVLKIPDANRPAAPSGKYQASMNILLAGADNGDAGGETIAQTVAKGTWTPGKHRSDTIMVLHLTSDRKHAYLISVPRDTYTGIDGYGNQKINAAFSFGGPSLYVQTLEQFTGLRMQHLAIIDWNGFRDLSTALGGVRVYIAQNTYDNNHHRLWNKGWATLAGNEALSYVRTRYGLSGGDFDRIKRQQNFMRAALSQAASKGSLTNPVRFKNLLQAITGNLTLDSAFSNSDIRSLAWSLRNLRPKDITFITTPMKRFASNQAGSVIIPDLAKTRELFGDVATDDLASYVTKYGGAGSLGSPTGVS